MSTLQYRAFQHRTILIIFRLDVGVIFFYNLTLIIISTLQFRAQL